MTSLMTGCASYCPRPLNNHDLATVLSKEDKCQLEKTATLLDHPQIPGIELDLAQPLSARQLSVLAVLISPDLKALRAKEGVACAQVFDAGLLPDPQLAAGYAYSITRGPGIFNAYSASLSWDIGNIATSRVKKEIQETATQQTRYDIAWQEWLMANQAQLLSTRIFFLQEKIAFTQKMTKIVYDSLTLLEEEYREYKIQIEDVAAQKAIYLDLVDQATSFERDLVKNKLALNQILGLCPSESVPLKLGELPSLNNLNANDLFEEAQVYRLDLLALQAGYMSQEAKLYQAILGQFPHCNIGISQGRDDTGIKSIGPNIILDLPIFNRNQGAIAIQTATREQLYLEYLARLNQTRSDIATLVEDIKLIKKEEKILQNALPTLRRTEHIFREGLKKKNSQTANYTTLLTSLLNNELRLINVKQSVAEQMIALQIATGRYCQTRKK
jgi:outer membrane protein TolC